jgi:tyrosinase
MNLPVIPLWGRALVVVSFLAVLNPGLAHGQQQVFQKTELPPQIVPFYGEVAAFKPATSSSRKAKANIDLAFLIKTSKVENVLVVPYDKENWYEPVSVKLEGKKLQAELVLNRNILVILDLGETARNNYLAMGQLSAARGLIPTKLQPKLCNLILCARDRFRADTIADRLPEGRQLPAKLERILPAVEVGPVDRPGTICDKCFEAFPNLLPYLVWRCTKFPIPNTVFIRRNIYNLSAAQITTLRNGVAVMKARPASDPTSWIYQAKMHALNSGSAAPLQDQCQHRQFLFFSWHRMYVYYFEKILRKASGDPQFALPYWNYTDNPAQGAIPAAYRTPANATNALYDGTRQSVYNGGAALPPSDVTYSAGFNLTNFTTPVLGNPSFGGRTVTAPGHFPNSAGSGKIEQSPHNNVHNDISGDMATGESPLDPVFWLHHSNIDRLWKRWLALGGGRTNPTGDNFWMTHVFTFFDENGAQVSLTGAQILNTVSQLKYRYDDEPLFVCDQWPTQKIVRAEPSPTKSEVVTSVKQPTALGDSRQDVPLTLPTEAKESLTRSKAKKFEKERLILQLRNIEYDAPVGITYLVFLNLPPNETKADHTHPNFIGTLGFFGKTESGSHQHGEGEGLTEEYDVTGLVQNTANVDDLKVTFVPSLPQAPPGRKDLQEQIARMKPQGNPRFSEMNLLRVSGD